MDGVRVLVGVRVVSGLKSSYSRTIKSRRNLQTSRLCALNTKTDPSLVECKGTMRRLMVPKGAKGRGLT